MRARGEGQTASSAVLEENDIDSLLRPEAGPQPQMPGSPALPDAATCPASTDVVRKRRVALL